MTAKFHPRCGYLACDPKYGECMGFCDPALLHRVDASQLQSGTTMHVPGNHEERDMPIDVAEPDEDNSMEMLAVALILTMVAVLIGLTFVGG